MQRGARAVRRRGRGRVRVAPLADWGTERIVDFLSTQRDLYAYLHDQTLRLINQGYTGHRDRRGASSCRRRSSTAWSARGYYGSVSHNVKAIYQRYLGWFDGNPAHLWELPPEKEGARIIALAGGADKALDTVERCWPRGTPTTCAGRPRWPATSCSAAGTPTARAGCWPRRSPRSGHGAENATWRNFYLRGAEELLGGHRRTAARPVHPVDPGRR